MILKVINIVESESAAGSLFHSLILLMVEIKGFGSGK